MAYACTYTRQISRKSPYHRQDHPPLQQSSTMAPAYHAKEARRAIALYHRGWRARRDAFHAQVKALCEHFGKYLGHFRLEKATVAEKVLQSL